MITKPSSISCPCPLRHGTQRGKKMRHRFIHSTPSKLQEFLSRLRAALPAPGALGIFCLTTCLCTITFAAEPAVFKVGFDIRNTRIEDARQYQPLLDYLGRTTGYRLELRFTRKHENIVNLLGKGSVDFAFIGA